LRCDNTTGCSFVLAGAVVVEALVDVGALADELVEPPQPTSAAPRATSSALHLTKPRHEQLDEASLGTRLPILRDVTREGLLRGSRTGATVCPKPHEHPVNNDTPLGSSDQSAEPVINAGPHLSSGKQGAAGVPNVQRLRRQAVQGVLHHPRRPSCGSAERLVRSLTSSLPALGTHLHGGHGVSPRDGRSYENGRNCARVRSPVCRRRTTARCRGVSRR